MFDLSKFNPVSIFRKKVVEDPVCGMDVTVNNESNNRYRYKNITYHFCGSGCKRAFEKEPGPYLSGEKKIDMD